MDNISEQDKAKAFEVIALVTDKMFLENTKADFASAIQLNDSSKLNSKLRTVYNALVDKQISELHAALSKTAYTTTALQDFSQRKRDLNR